MPTASLLAAPPVPDAARAALGDGLPVLERYAALLAGPGVERGLLGPRETPRLWERHVLNCAGPAALAAPGDLVVDVGSGAGLPGLVVAALRPDVRVLLVEPLLRRATFLSEAVEVLGLRAVEVRRARAEELAGTVEADLAVARAVAPLDRLAGWTLPLLREGGRLVALKGASAEEELAAADDALRALGGRDARVVELGDEAALTASRAVVVERGPAPAARPSRRRGRR
ncbi:MAG TPA: 16S rRNA (guanine(527)-N(7))-methyltransferase RsmG [Mycobacteriales bacterium]|nr:16S rRNA (guanine(527)-N(7))-methyltransferase RsmG [Mycobacteriales bacterium]